jgi:hypothetical protein
MKITIESTTKIVELNGVPARVWEGHTESGIPVHCFITRIAVNNQENTEEFDKQLKEHQAPRNADIESYPLRMLI